MTGKTYPIIEEDSLIFSFISSGTKGNISKLVIYEPINDFLFNLAFGDQKWEQLDIDDEVVSDNGDIKMVMTTVISTLEFFFAIHPDKFVYFTGSDQRRTRMYNYIISNHLEDIVERYFIEGETEVGIESFRKKQNYTAFYISKK